MSKKNEASEFQHEVKHETIINDNTNIAFEEEEENNELWIIVSDQNVNKKRSACKNEIDETNTSGEQLARTDKPKDIQVCDNIAENGTEN